MAPPLQIPRRGRPVLRVSLHNIPNIPKWEEGKKKKKELVILIVRNRGISVGIPLLCTFVLMDLAIILLMNNAHGQRRFFYQLPVLTYPVGLKL